MSTMKRKRNKMKLMFATASIVLLRRTAYMLALITLPFSPLQPANHAAYAADADEGRFTDTEGHWAEEPIVKSVSEGIADGYNDGTSRPDRAVSRAEFIAMMTESLHIPAAASSLDETALSAQLQSLRDAGIIDENLFAADGLERHLQRSEMIRLVLSALDPAEVEAGADKQTERAAAVGLIDGEEEASADREVTRAEAIVILQRLQQAVNPA